MKNETFAEGLQRKRDERAPDRAARRERMEQATPVRRGLSKLWAALWTTLTVLLLWAVLLGLVALAVWFLVMSAGIILKLVGAVLIVVVVSTAWRQIRGR